MAQFPSNNPKSRVSVDAPLHVFLAMAMLVRLECLGRSSRTIVSWGTYLDRPVHDYNVVVRHDVFVSFSSHDQDFADRIMSACERAGIVCWISSRDIEPGSPDYGDLIYAAINSCKLVLVIYSEHSRDSPHVASEAQIAVHLKRAILPVKVSETELIGSLCFRLINYEWFNKSRRLTNADIPRLVEHLKWTLGAQRPITPDPLPRPIPFWTRVRLRITSSSRGAGRSQPVPEPEPKGSRPDQEPAASVAEGPHRRASTVSDTPPREPPFGMKLLHSEIDVVPGRKPQRQPLPEGFVGAGTGVLRLTNTTSRLKSYQISVRCYEPFWQDAWFQVAGLPPFGGPENYPPPGKPDQPGPRSQSITIYVNEGGTRDVFLMFFVPEKSECRAGAYPVEVVVETRVIGDNPQKPGRARCAEIPATVIVRPFYRWSINYLPEDRRVGFFRRGAEYELIVENQGNDWLYCDLLMPRPHNVLVETTTARMAVPPPLPGKPSIRAVPFKAISRVHTIGGVRKALPLPITVQRVHAPTVPPLPEEAMFGPSGSNFRAAVSSSSTVDVAAPEISPTLTYCPLIPSLFPDFTRGFGSGSRGLLFFVLALVATWNGATLAWDCNVAPISDLQVQTSHVRLGDLVSISGRNLDGSRIIVYDASGKYQVGDPLQPVGDVREAGRDRVEIALTDPSLAGKQIRIGAQKNAGFTFVGSLLPISMANTVLQIEPVLRQSSASALGAIDRTVAPGQPLVIKGLGFGDQPGSVALNGIPAVVQSWSNSKIAVRIPDDAVHDRATGLQVYDAKGNLIPVTPPSFVVHAPKGSTTGR